MKNQLKRFIGRCRTARRRAVCRRVFGKWFRFYLRKGMKPWVAVKFAETVLMYRVPDLIYYEDYLDYLMQECLGLPPCREKLNGDSRIQPPVSDRPMTSKDFSIEGSEDLAL